MNKDSYAFLKNLMSQPSPSGFEVPAQKVVRARLKGFAQRISTDVHGNVYGTLNETAPLKIMMAGHVDEIGLMITHIDDKGFLFVGGIGGWDPIMAVGQRVCVLAEKGEVAGVIGRKPIHLLEPAEKTKEIKLSDLWIDIGAANRLDAQKVVAVGDPVVVQPDFLELRNDLVSSRAFDNRVGAWVVVETLRALKKRKIKVAVYAVSTVQEELGLRGAFTSAYTVKPDVGIAVDVGFSSDFPGGEPRRTGEIALGKGPILHVGANINPVLGRLLVDTAKRKRIPWQMQAEPRATGTDANAIQVTRGGCATALVSVPNRYMHSPIEVISLKDLDNTVQLLAETICSMSKTMDFRPR